MTKHENENEYDIMQEIIDKLHMDCVHVLSILVNICPSVISFNDKTEPDWAVLYVNGPTGQMMWHISVKDLHILTRYVDVVDHDHPDAQWDGHSILEKYTRLKEFVDILAHTRSTVTQVISNLDLDDPEVTTIHITSSKTVVESYEEVT